MEITLDPQRLVPLRGLPDDSQIADPRAATKVALAAPSDFPPLARAIVPGDHVTVAVEAGVPAAAEILAGAVDELLAAGVEPQNLLVLQTQEGARRDGCDLRRCLSPALAADIELLTHDPQDAGQLRYLAATERGERVYLHRALVDADLVLPIGSSRCDDALAWLGDAAGVFPAFSNLEARRRFRRWRHAGNGAAGGGDEFTAETNEVSWLLGVCYAVQAVPGAGGHVQAILAGGFDPILRQAQQLADSRWRASVTTPAGLVVAAVSGGSNEQHWQNVGRALAAASRVVAADGAIALCTRIDQPPSPSLVRIGQAEDLQAAVRLVQKDRADDALAAIQLARALEQARVYLLSNLDDAVVEELGITPLGNMSEVERLAGRHATTLILDDAQYCVPAVVAADHGSKR